MHKCKSGGCLCADKAMDLRITDIVSTPLGEFRACNVEGEERTL